MEKVIRPVRADEYEATLDLVERVFTAHADAEEGRLVRSLVSEIRAKEYYLPELDLVAVDPEGEIIGYVMFSRFHIEGRYLGRLLLLSPAAIRTDLQRRHISRDMIEYGFERARELGYTVCMVEGNPQNYRSRGFVTSADYGIYADESVGLPSPECLMVCELALGGLDGMHGYVNYKMYDALR